jgi:TPR repeat protein
MFLRGERVPRDYALARDWFEKAAAKEFGPAMFSLGQLHEQGLGVTRDLAEAQRWYEKAVADDYEPAGKALARLRDAAGSKQ